MSLPPIITRNNKQDLEQTKIFNPEMGQGEETVALRAANLFEAETKNQSQNSMREFDMSSRQEHHSTALRQFVNVNEASNKQTVQYDSEKTPGSPRIYNAKPSTVNLVDGREKKKIKSLRCCICVLVVFLIMLIGLLVTSVFFAQTVAEMKGGLTDDDDKSFDEVQLINVAAVEETHKSAEEEIKDKANSLLADIKNDTNVANDEKNQYFTQAIGRYMSHYAVNMAQLTQQLEIDKETLQRKVNAFKELKRVQIEHAMKQLSIWELDLAQEEL